MVCPLLVRRLGGSLVGVALIVGSLAPIDEVRAASTPTPKTTAGTRTATPRPPTATARAATATSHVATAHVATATPRTPTSTPRQPTATPTRTRTAAPRTPTSTTSRTPPPKARQAAQVVLPTATYTVTRTPAPVRTPAPSPTPAPTKPPTRAPTHTATATATATATVSPTATQPPPTATRTPVELPTLPRADAAVRGWLEGALLALDVPIRSQLDGSEYQASNCGPASLAMVLDAFGVHASIPGLRNLANRRQGTYDRESGISLPVLADVAAGAGLRPLGLVDNGAFRRWSVDDVRGEVRRGHPVITLVRMRELPDHAGSRADTDHYVVVVGLDGDRLLVNDPARAGELGFRRPLTAVELERAWDASSIPRHALAFAAPEGLAELSFQPPGTGNGPGTALLQPTEVAPAMTLPASAPPAAGAPQVVINLTPVIVVNVNIPPQALQPAAPAPPTPIPVPTRDRWARIESPAMPTTQPPPPTEQPAIVLAAPPPTSNEGTLRWIARFAMLSVGALVLRWSLK